MEKTEGLQEDNKVTENTTAESGGKAPEFMCPFFSEQIASTIGIEAKQFNEDMCRYCRCAQVLG
ncbi:MAG: hypothetical protein HY667_07215 [Chloroflexi bacterium]|nr:hypothetical protein [Chloroflexota bacterium]